MSEPINERVVIDEGAPEATERRARPTTREERTHDFFDNWLRFTAGLTFEEKGVYTELAALVIRRGGPVPIDFAIRALHIDPRKWRRILRSLEERPAVVVKDGELMVTALRGRLYKSGYRHIKDNIPSALRWQVFRRDEYRCVECGSYEDLTADHIVSEREGGDTVPGNLQTLCRPCNSKKGAS